jgi:hypothetical protein
MIFDCDKCFLCGSSYANILKLMLEIKETFYTGKKIILKVCGNCVEK